MNTYRFFRHLRGKNQLLLMTGLALILSSLLLIKAVDFKLLINSSLLGPTAENSQTKRSISSDNFQKSTIYFAPNNGAFDKRVKFTVAGTDYRVFLTKTGITYAFLINTQTSADKSQSHKGAKSYKGFALKIAFSGARPDVALRGEDRQSGKVNYFIGRDRSKWHVNVPTFSKVTYLNLYKGINLTYSGDNRVIKYKFNVAPGADYRDIKFNYQGAGSLLLDKQGNLLIKTGLGTLIDKKPAAYQISGGKKVKVSVDYVVNGAVVGFNVSSYNKNLPLVIDPGLEYSTFIGGGGDDKGHGIAVDNAGNAYITGETLSTDYPMTSGAYDTIYNNGGDVFVTKLNSTGSSLIFSTFIGGNNFDAGYDIDIDGAGNVYVTGETDSADFPTTSSAFDKIYNGGGDVFVTKLAGSGANLVYSTFVGGAGLDIGRGLAVDAGGKAHVVGQTSSSDFPTPLLGYDKTYNGGTDAFVFRLSDLGSALPYSTFIGGGGFDSGQDIVLDSADDAYITGYTYSSSFPTLNAYDSTFNFGGGDAFITKLNNTGQSLLYSTYIGGDGADRGYGIALGSGDKPFITGQTSSTDFPKKQWIQNSLKGSIDAFVTSLISDGSDLYYSTYLGGSANDYGEDIAVKNINNSNYAIVVGHTMSNDFPMAGGAYDSTFNGAQDVFVTRLNSPGWAPNPMYSTYIGGQTMNIGEGIALDSYLPSTVYLTGYSGSNINNNYPTTPGVYQQTPNGAGDVIVTKIHLAGSPNTGLNNAVLLVMSVLSLLAGVSLIGYGRVRQELV